MLLVSESTQQRSDAAAADRSLRCRKLRGAPPPAKTEADKRTPDKRTAITPRELAVLRLVKAPFGRVLRAIREDEVFALSLGKNVAAFKVWAFVVGAILAALAGGIYAAYVTYIDPNSFTVQESIFILAIVI